MLRASAPPDPVAVVHHSQLLRRKEGIVLKFDDAACRYPQRAPVLSPGALRARGVRDASPAPPAATTLSVGRRARAPVSLTRWTSRAHPLPGPRHVSPPPKLMVRSSYTDRMAFVPE